MVLAQLLRTLPCLGVQITLLLHVLHVQGLALCDRASGYRGGRIGQRFASLELRRAVERRAPHHVAIENVDRRRAGLAKPCGALRDRIEHRFHIARRARDNTQDLADRRLLLERLLGLVEQAHVLDRNHRLVGEGLEECELLVGERPHLHASRKDRADRNAFAHQRHSQCRTMPDQPLHCLGLRPLFVRFCKQVVDVDRAAFKHAPAAD